jgi:hypothetical protein
VRSGDERRGQADGPTWRSAWSEQTKSSVTMQSGLQQTLMSCTTCGWRSSASNAASRCKGKGEEVVTR